MEIRKRYLLYSKSWAKQTLQTQIESLVYKLTTLLLKLVLNTNCTTLTPGSNFLASLSLSFQSSWISSLYHQLSLHLRQHLTQDCRTVTLLQCQVIIVEKKTFLSTILTHADTKYLTQIYN